MCVHRQYIHRHDDGIPCQFISKEVFEEVTFSSNIIKTPRVLKRRSKGRERERKRKKRKKGALIVSSNKGEVNILRGEKHFNFKNPF
jgi:oligoribonuclease NrnB/cAMP/cGMP phosphodiesterase (DHH superfamily)